MVVGRLERLTAWWAALVGGLLFLGASTAGAQAISIVGGSPATMNIISATAGLPPDVITNAATRYRVRTNNVSNPQRITARLNAAMPAGMTLTVSLVPPTGATSPGAVALDATARDVVVNITNTVNQTNFITYVISATAAAGVVISQTRTVTFTLTTYP